MFGFIIGLFWGLQHHRKQHGLAGHSKCIISCALVSSSFCWCTLALFILTLIFNRSLKIKITHPDIGKIKPIHFIGGVLGVVFVTSNIILMPF